MSQGTITSSAIVVVILMVVVPYTAAAKSLPPSAPTAAGKGNITVITNGQVRTITPHQYLDHNDS